MHDKIIEHAYHALQAIWAAPAAKPETITVCIPTTHLSAKKLLQGAFKEPVRYFNDPNGGMEVVGYDSVLQLNGIQSLSNILGLVQENEDALFIGGFPFFDDTTLHGEWADFGQNHVALPRFTFMRSHSNDQLRINVLRSELENALLPEQLIGQLKDIMGRNPVSRTHLEVKREQLVPSKSKWLRNVAQVVDDLDSNQSKVVLARKKVVAYTTSLTPQLFIDHVQPAMNSCLYYYQPTQDAAFLANTPETLFRSQDDNITVQAIAGTRHIHADSDRAEVEASLQNSQKDSLEQQIVCDFVEQSLDYLCQDYQREHHRRTLQLNHLLHLSSSYTGVLRRGYSVADALQTLHPTPAVSGYPIGKSQSVLRTLEGMQRGLYAGPAGYITKHTAHFIVAIRSVLIEDANLHVFGGAGIIRESQPEKEWQETADKIESIQCLLQLQNHKTQ